MAVGSEGLPRIDIDLNSVMAEAEFLPQLSEMWEQLTEDGRVDYILEWQDLMARLETLDRECRDGRMTSEQKARYRVLLGALRTTLPTMVQLDLDLPAVSLDFDSAA